MMRPIQEELARCRSDLARFNSTIVGGPSYWHKQREICQAIASGLYQFICVPTGNGVGKSFAFGRIALGLALLNPGSQTILAAPTGAQLAEVGWSNFAKAIACVEDPHRGIGYPVGGKFQGMTYRWDEDWKVEGWGSGSVEAKSGRHAHHLHWMGDEASGIKPQVMEAADSLNASLYILFGNPLRPEGRFYELCKSRNPKVKVIHISSLESPDIHKPRHLAGRGLADADWLENVRWEYGEESIWWKSHVLGLFPDELMEALLPIAWLDYAASMLWTPNGSPTRMGIDLGKGTGGDPSTIVVRDDRGIRECEESNRWNFEQTAARAKALAERHLVTGGRVTYDASGLGVDFGARLADVGLVGAKDFMGGRAGGEKFVNLRSAASWEFRRRLDPNRSRAEPDPENPEEYVRVTQPPFAIPRHLVMKYRRELQECRVMNADGGKTQVEPKEELIARIKQSPNFLDACIMTFAYPHA